MPDVLRLKRGRAALEITSTGAVVKGILHTGSITLMYGPPKSGKSFLATDLLLSIAAGEERWMGHKIVKPGHVLYVACEGHAGFPRRLRAAAIYRWDKLESFPDEFILAEGRPQLIVVTERSATPHPDDILKKFDDLARVGIHPVACFIDTVFRSFGGGTVNASEHINAYVTACTMIAVRECAVGLVHHATKSRENKSPVGSVSLIAAADTIISTEKGKGTDEHTWQVEAAKDDGATAPRMFKLESVVIGHDPDGDDVNSCVVVDMEPEK